MKTRFRLLIGGLVFATMQSALAENGTMTLPRTVEAGNGFSIQTTGSGKAVLYIVGLGQVLKRDVQLGPFLPVISTMRATTSSCSRETRPTMARSM
jgi:hypothetical protein